MIVSRAARYGNAEVGFFHRRRPSDLRRVSASNSFGNQSAIEHQDELALKVDGQVCLTDVLIAAKLLTAKTTELEKYSALRRIGVAAGDLAMGVMEEYAEELKGVRSSLSE